MYKKERNDFDTLLFPHYKCFVCGRESFDEKYNLCERCKNDFPFIEGHVCNKCGMPILEGNMLCDNCKNTKFLFDAARAAFVYNEITDHLLYKLKYGGKKYIAEFFGDLIFDVCKNWNIDVDMVVPVPLHEKREKKRGYNQSELIAERFCELTGLPLCTDIIFRTKETPNQTKLTKEERMHNLSGAFSFNSSVSIAGKSILIIDDVFTTGSTSNEICKVLRRHKPKSIYVLTAGKTK